MRFNLVEVTLTDASRAYNVVGADEATGEAIVTFGATSERTARDLLTAFEHVAWVDIDADAAAAYGWQG